MELSAMPCDKFAEVLSSKAAVPGGGAASALAAALGVSLAGMVASLTEGKKKYAAVEEEMLQDIETCRTLSGELLSMVNRDARMFGPLSAAYALPQGTPEEREKKSSALEKALKEACQVPLELLEKCSEALDLIRELSKKGSAIAISDAGAAAAMCRSALQGAALSIYSNTKNMKDCSAAEKINAKTDAVLSVYLPMADAIYEAVRDRLH